MLYEAVITCIFLFLTKLIKCRKEDRKVGDCQDMTALISQIRVLLSPFYFTSVGCCCIQTWEIGGADLVLVGSGHTEQLPAAHHPLRTPVKATCAGGDPSGMSLLSLGGFSCRCLQSSWRQQVPLILPWCCCCFVFAVPLCGVASTAPAQQGLAQEDLSQEDLSLGLQVPLCWEHHPAWTWAELQISQESYFQ